MNEIPDDFPQKLKDTVTEYLAQHDGAKILTTQTSHFSHNLSTYKVFTEWGNFFAVFSSIITFSSKPEQSKSILQSDHMIAGEILTIIRNSDWFKEYIR